jgi:methionyl-tRNA formyltransferase
MDQSKLRIVYMGTPEFAVPSLRKLIENGYSVIGVVTAPDKPAGRGQKIQESPVKQFAVARNLPVLQPENLKDPLFLEALRAMKPDLQVVVAFRMLPYTVWALPPLGTFNLHASLLPQYRGAAPINHVLINGEKKTGLTTFFLEREIDTGQIIYQEEEEITDMDNAGTLHDRLMVKGAALVLRTVQSIEQGTNPRMPQRPILTKNHPLKPAPKIFRENCRIDWSKPGIDIYNLVRGLSPYPAAFSELELSSGQRTILKIFQTHFLPENHTLSTGSIKTDRRTFLHIAAVDGFIELEMLQLEGKKKLPVAEFLRGFQIGEEIRAI